MDLVIPSGLLKDLKIVDGREGITRVLWINLHDGSSDRRTYQLLKYNELHKLPVQDLVETRSKLEALESDHEQRIHKETGLNGELSSSIFALIEKINQAVEKANLSSSKSSDDSEWRLWGGL